MTERRSFGLVLAGAISFGYGFAFVEPGQPAWRPLALAGAGVVALARGGRRTWAGSDAAQRWHEIRQERADTRVRWRGLNMATCPRCGAVLGSAVLSPRQLLKLHGSACREDPGPAGRDGRDDGRPLVAAKGTRHTSHDAGSTDVAELAPEHTTTG